MSYNGSGIFSLVAGNPVVTGTTISSTWANNTLSDIATGLSTAITKDGQTTPTNNIPMGGFKLTGLGAGVAAGQSLRFEQLFSQGVEQAIATAATMDIGAVNSNFLSATGSVGVTSLGTNYNGPKFVRFVGAPLLTNSATLILPGGVNLQTTAGDVAIFAPKATAGVADGWDLAAYLPAGGISPRAVRIDVASVAGTVDLTVNAAATDDIRITGALAITKFTVSAGRVVRVTAGGAFSLANNANIVTQTGGTLALAAGDTFALRATATDTVEVLFYSRAVTSAASRVQVQGGGTYGSAPGNVIKRYTNVLVNQGADITYADDAVNGATFTINTPGVYGIDMDATGAGNTLAGMSMNSAQLTTSLFLITAANRIDANTAPGGNVSSSHAVRYFASGTVIRSHTDGQAPASSAVEQFNITRIV